MTEDLDRAASLFRKGDLRSAEDAYEKILKKDPDNLETHGQRAWLFVTMGRYEDAIAEYRYIMERNPHDLEAAYRYSEVLGKMGRYSEAIEGARSVLNQDSTHMGALDVWRQCLVDQGLAQAQSPRQDFSHSTSLAHPLNPVIKQLEEDPANFPASVFPQVGQMLYSLVRCARPRLVLETGCFVGYSTLCMAQALEENKDGHIHSFDLFLPLAADYHSPVAGNCADALQVARAHLERAGLAHRVTFHKGDSSSGIVDNLTAGRDVVDFAFIDGDHRVKGCFKDWRAVLRLLRPGGIVVLHDTIPDNCGWVGPHALIEELHRRPREFQAINFPTPEGYGLGVIQRVGGGRPYDWKPSIPALLKEYLQSAIWRRRR